MPPTHQSLVGDELYYGRVFGNYIKDIPLDKICRVDFVKQGNNVITNDSIINFPGRGVSQIYIRNDGPASIQFSMNDASINDPIIGPVFAPTISREFKWPGAIIKAVNLKTIQYKTNTTACVAIDVSI